MKTIQLTQGFIALVDDEDFERLNQFKWCVSRRKGRALAVRGCVTLEGKKKLCLMHREILNAPDSLEVDHVFQDAGAGVIDNRKENLRLATSQENNRNRRKQFSETSSKLKGVCFLRERQKWLAQIRIGGKQIFLGHFEFEIDAACAYDAAARILFGQFAHTNFPYVFIV